MVNRLHLVVLQQALAVLEVVEQHAISG